MTPLVIEGMHGLGDNLHQRAIIRQWMERRDVWLETSWVSVYHDLIANGLKVLGKHTRLRTQTKNANRESELFSRQSPPRIAQRLRVSYPPDYVRRFRSVLGAMCAVTSCDIQRADFRLPVPQEWQNRAQAWVDRWRPSKPLMIYRPLNERKEWTGNQTRNPNHDDYFALYNSIRDRFFVVSVGDISPPEEWLVGHPADVDATCHRGELEFETLAGLFARSALIFTSPGFAIVLAQSVGAPLVGVFGGYERSYSFDPGARFNRSLFIEPIAPCDCFKHTCGCEKRVDVGSAKQKLEEFVDGLANRS